MRKKLQCKSFHWYLTNIWPEHFFPTDLRFFGKILLIDTNSNVHYEYLKILNQFDFEHNGNWEYFIHYLNDRRKSLQNLLEKSMTSFCLQKPESHGVLSLPFGQSSLRRCSNESAISEIFVIKNDGQVFY